MSLLARLALVALALANANAAFGAESPRPSTSALLDSVWALRGQGRHAEMESLATAVRLRVEGDAHPDTLALAEAWLAIAKSRNSRNLFADSWALHAASRSLALYEASGIASDSLLAEVHHAFGATHTGRRAYRDALAHHAIALELRRRGLAGDDLLIPAALYNVGGAYRRVGQLDSALVAYQAALDHWQRRPRDAGNWIGDVYAEIGLIRELRGEETLAEQAYAAAIRSHEEILGPDDPALDFSLNRAAGFSYRRGEVAQVIDYAERAMRILSRQVAPDDERLVAAQVNLAQSYRQLGDNERAFALFESVLPTLERLRGQHDEYVLTARLTHASLCAELGDTTRALALFEELERAAVGDSILAESQTLAWTLAHQADLRRYGKEPDLALRLAREAIAANRRIQQPSPSCVAYALLVQMSIAAEREDWAEFERLDRELETALSDLSLLSEDYTGALSYRSHMAARRGRAAEAFLIALDAARLQRESLVQNVRALSDRQALILSTKVSAPLDQLLLAGTVGDSQMVRRTWDELVRWRGLVGAEVARRRLQPLLGADSVLVAEHSAWIRAERQLAQYEVRAASEARDASTDSTVRALRTESDEAERRLVRDFPASRSASDSEEVSLDAVLATLSEGQSLVGFAQSPALDGQRRLVAFIGRGDAGAPCSIDLGPIDELEPLIRRWNAQLSDVDPSTRSEEACREAGESVRERIWDPVFAASGEPRDLFLVTESPLNGLPWCALPNGTHGYLAEAGVRIHVLDAERDLLRAHDEYRHAGLLAVGGIDYDRAESSDSPPTLTIAANLRASLSDCDIAAIANLPPLPGTAEEVREVQRIWDRSESAQGAAMRLEGSDATELQFKRLAAEGRILHLATHGIVLNDTCGVRGAGMRGVGGVAPIDSRQSFPAEKRTTKGTADSRSSPAKPVAKPRSPSPWLGRRVLLALADANHAREHTADENEGLLTAEEVTTLDLRGVEWVLLSACHSAAGEAWGREGMLGMQRAFRLAGARTVIASQWAVDDQAAREWMRALYASRARGFTRAGDAIAAASKTVLDARRRSGLSTHPFFWAPFTATGE